MIRRGYVDVPEGQMHHRSVAGDGSGALPIVFLHQTASSGRMWEKVMARLAGARPLAAMDTPGFGASFDPEATPAMTDYVRWIDQAILALGHCRAHVVGHHTGAAIGIALAASQPERVASLALIGPSPLTAEERAPLMARLGAPFRPTRSGSYLLKNWEYLRVGGADADMTVMHAEMIDMLRAWESRPHAYSAVWGQDALALLPGISCPVTVMAAPDDLMFPYLERALEACPNARREDLRSGANYEPDLAPDEVAAALLIHLDRAGDDG